MAEILFLAVITGILLFKLNSVLGRRTGEEKRRPSIFDDPETATVNTQEIDVTAMAKLLDPVEAPLAEQLRTAYPQFDVDKFKNSVEQVYTLVAEGYSKGDLPQLQALLAPSLFKAFQQAIQERQAKGEALENTVIRVKAITLKAVDVANSEILATVAFSTEQVNILKDQKGNIVSGSPDYIEDVQDTWLFVRPEKSTSPQWWVKDIHVKAKE